jgi:FolB domain-containing protein
MDVIRIRGLEFDCIVGLRPLEREREQRVHIELALGLDLAPAGRSGRIALTCDYTEIAEEVMAMLRFRRYQLIEMATEELAAMLLGVHSAVEFVDIHLDKPAALDGRARAASVEIHRARAAYPSSKTAAPFGTSELLLETREARLYLLTLDPGAELVAGHPREASWVEWAIDGELRKNGDTLALHVPVHGSVAEAATYANASSTPAVLFRCICPSRLDG